MTSGARLRILIAREPGETRFALVDRDDVLEIVLVRDMEVQPGAVYVGRAGARIAGDGACRVDLGRGEPGYLQSKRLPAEGQWVHVVVTAAARAGKGPTLKRVSLSDPLEGPAREISAAPTPAAEWLIAHGEAVADIVVATAEAIAHAGVPPGRSVSPHRGPRDLFDAVGATDALEEAVTPSLTFLGGGSLVFEVTAAAWMIDINAAGQSIADVNRLAMIAIARQLRLRNLSGHILIDLIPTRGRSQFKQQLERLVASDPTSTQVAGFTPLGMIELTRQRRRASLPELMLDHGAPSARAAAYRVLARAVREVATRHATKVAVNVAPAVAHLLTGDLRAATLEAEKSARVQLVIAGKDTYPLDRIEFAT